MPPRLVEGPDIMNKKPSMVYKHNLSHFLVKKKVSLTTLSLYSFLQSQNWVPLTLLTASCFLCLSSTWVLCSECCVSGGITLWFYRAGVCTIELPHSRMGGSQTSASLALLCVWITQVSRHKADSGAAGPQTTLSSKERDLAIFRHLWWSSHFRHLC